MNNDKNNGGRHLLRYLAAAVVAVPVGGIAWIELLYLAFGFTGEDATPAVNIVALILAFGPAFGWSLYRTRRPAEVVRRGCHLGAVVALLLPAVAVVVLLLWEIAPGPRDAGMGGLMFYALPLVAVAAAFLLAVPFWLGSRFAASRLEGTLDP